jgi:hypothetical protein
MALGVGAVPFTYVAHILGVTAIVLVFIWNIHFRGGLAWSSDNKALIFNQLFWFWLWNSSKRKRLSYVVEGICKPYDIHNVRKNVHVYL